MAITTSTRRADIFKQLYAVIKDNVVTVGVKITNAFVDSYTEIPQVVVNIPQTQRTREGFSTSGVSDYSGTIEVDLIAGSTKDLALLADDVENAVFSNLASLDLQSLDLGDGTIGALDVGGKSARIMTLPFSFMLKR